MSHVPSLCIAHLCHVCAALESLLLSNYVVCADVQRLAEWKLIVLESALQQACAAGRLLSVTVLSSSNFGPATPLQACNLHWTLFSLEHLWSLSTGHGPSMVCDDADGSYTAQVRGYVQGNQGRG